MTDLVGDFVAITVTLGVATIGVVALSRGMHARDKRRRRNPQTRAISRLERRHEGQSGLIVEVLWPLVLRYRLEATVEGIVCSERKRFFGSKVWFSRHGLERQRPFWVPMTAGKHYVTLETYGRRAESKELRIDLKPGEHKLLLCWPAKRGFVTPERRWTEWKIVPLP